MKVNTIVSDALLKQLSAETTKIGRQVRVRETLFSPGAQAFIANVIILPQAEFYRNKFMTLYRQHQHNAVKALKDLAADFPFVPDYHLGLGFVIHIQLPGQLPQTAAKVLLLHELELVPGYVDSAAEDKEAHSVYTEQTNSTTRSGGATASSSQNAGS